MCYNKCPTVTRCTSLYFRGRGTSPEHKKCQEFTKYIGQPSPAPVLESALARSWLLQWALLRSPLRYLNRMIPISPARTCLLRIDVMGRTYITSFPSFP